MADLPPQVQRQLDETNAIEAALAPQPPAPVAPAPSAEPATPAATTAASPLARVDTEQTWEQRYRSLQGMHRADQARMTGQIKDLEKQVADLKAATTTSQPPAPAADAPRVTDQDVQTFGPELVELIKRAAAEQVAQERQARTDETARLTTKVTELETRTVETAETNAEQRKTQCLVELEKLCPTFDKVNRDPRFMEWLDVIEPAFGLTRKQGLQDAFANFDALRLSLFFNAFLAETAAPGEVPPVTEDPPAPPPQSAELERLVQPDGSSNSSQPPPAPSQDDATRTWTTSEMDAVYRDNARGKYKGREAEFNALDAAITLAAAQGRVVDR